MAVAVLLMYLILIRILIRQIILILPLEILPAILSITLTAPTMVSSLIIVNLQSVILLEILSATPPKKEAQFSMAGIQPLKILTVILLTIIPIMLKVEQFTLTITRL